jgi:hypothetical protein
MPGIPDFFTGWQYKSGEFHRVQKTVTFHQDDRFGNHTSAF